MKRALWSLHINEEDHQSYFLSKYLNKTDLIVDVFFVYTHKTRCSNIISGEKCIALVFFDCSLEFITFENLIFNERPKSSCNIIRGKFREVVGKVNSPSSLLYINSDFVTFGYWDSMK